MIDKNPGDILRQAHVIAVVGISDKPDRPSFHVSEYLSKYYTIIPVNPKLKTWNGLKCYPTLLDVPSSTHIDVVDIFRVSEAVPPIVDHAIQRGNIGCIWMQQGIVHEEAAKKARAAGMSVVMDACTAVVHAQVRSRP